MATTPGFLTEWPWTPLGNFKYLILAPWAVHATYSYAVKGADERDLGYFLIFPFLLFRMLHNQIWISFSRYRTAKGNTRIIDKGIDFDQVDRERSWDDQIIFNGILFYIGHNTLQAAARIPFYRTDGVVLTALLHAGPVEFLYYWFHRALHHHFLYSRYHSHHHSSIVTEPITSVIHPFGEHIVYFVLFAIPLLTTILTYTASIVSFAGYITYIDFMNNMGHCNFELIPKCLFSFFPPLKYILYTPSFHSLHHTQFRTNYSLFMPFYDYVYGTMDKSSDSLYEMSLKRVEESPDVVHLTHLTTPESIYHLRLGFASLASKPYASKWYLILMWPLTLCRRETHLHSVMPGGGGDTAADGGEFLLSLLQKKPHHHFHHPQTPTHPQNQHLNFDPAVALMGPTTDLSPPPYPPNLNRFSQHNTGNNSQFQGNHGAVGDDFWRLGSSGADAIGGNVTRHLLQQKPQNHKLMFGSLPFEIQNQKGMFDGNSLRDGNRQLDPRVNSNSDPSNALRHGIYNSRELQELRGGGGRGGGWGQHQQHTIRPPPGFPSQTSGGGGIWDTVNREKGNFSSISDADDKGRRFFTEDSRTPMSNMYPQSGLSKQQFEQHRMHNFDSEIADHANGDENQGRGWDGLRPGYDRGSHELDDLGEEIVHSLLLEDDSNEKSEQKKNRNARDKDCRSDSRGQRLLSQRMRNLKRMMGCRDDIYKLNAPFLAIYESLIPPEKEKANQRHLFTLLEKLVAKEWPEARLYLYGSCASTFGVCKSDIDVCLAIDDVDVDKPKVLLKLAEILQSDNLENVQALTRARVPIVKLMDPVTGISCDICINNVLAVVNTKLLRDYAQIDVRLHQLAFIVKHWAKSRGVNETYQGTLSSYAYVLMCIHFLQQRRPAILPCLQEMETTYSVTVDDIKCAFFDKVEKLRTFGSRNRESIAQLVWGFFNYWAYCHDYANDVISVRTGSIISKRAKDWTRRIGNDRHLICIEDPFEISHDLGRVVDKYSIKVLREEFERAADIMQFDPNPCISLFEPYVVS